MINGLLLLVIGGVFYLLDRRLKKLETVQPVTNEFDVQKMYRITHDGIREHEQEHHR